MDKVPEIGKIITSPQERDAIHIAVMPVVAGTNLQPGDHIGPMFDGRMGDADYVTPIGIVDPYLRMTVHEGEQFYLFLYPNTITSLKHLWTHPVLDQQESLKGLKEINKIIASQQWLKDYAKSLDVAYDELMNEAKAFLRKDANGSRQGWGITLDGTRHMNAELDEDFWDHFHVVTDIDVTSEDRRAGRDYGFFSCAC